jgi:adenylate cyclase
LSAAAPRLATFVAELRRRRVFRVAAVYAVVAFVLVQVADIVFPALQLPEWTVTLVVALAILGFPLALALAWVFDVTPEGVRRTRSTRREQRRAASATAPAGEAERADRRFDSIAVLPFVDLSPDKDQEYFSDGLTEELLNVLAKVRGLRVPARTSSFAFKGQNTDIGEIGERLHVETVLEGSVRTWESRVLITAQLIAVEDGYHLWSETYKRDLKDIFAVQEEIARSIVRTLRGELLGEAEAPQVREATADPEAYRLYLKGWHFASRFSADDYRRAIPLFEEAARRDPGFARAHASLSNVWGMLGYLGAEPPAEALERARALAGRALELDPLLDEAYVARGRAALFSRDFEAAERDLRRALELSPAFARAHIALGMLLSYLCRPEEAVAAIRQAAELDPLWAGALNNLASVYSSLGRNEEALACYEQALELSPGSSPIAGNIAGAPDPPLHAGQPDGRHKGVLASVLLRAGKREEALSLVAEVERLREQGHVRLGDLAVLYALLGRHDEAFAALEAGVGEPVAASMASAADIDPLREDPRWEPLLRRVGFPEDAIRRSRELYELRRAAAAGPAEASVP